MNNSMKAELLGISPEANRAGFEFQIGETVWYKPRKSRMWRQGKVSSQYRSRGRHVYEWYRVDWNIAAQISHDPPRDMCEHGYVRMFRWSRHPCPRCRRCQ